MFILVGLLIIVAVIYYMGASRQLFGDRITLYAVFNNVEGLKEGNNVWFSGIKVGTVKGVELVSDSLVRAKMAITEDAAQFIKKDSYAAIESQGLMGNKVITISAGSVTTASVEDGDELEAQDPIGIESIVRTVKETAEEAKTLAVNLSAITESIKNGEGALGKLINDTVLTERIDNSMILIQQSSRNVRKLTSEMSEVVENINKGDGLATRLIHDEEWSREIGATLDSLKRTSDMMTNAGRELKDFTELLNQKKGTIQQLLQDSVMARDLHQAIINIKQGTRELDKTLNTVNESWLLNLFSGKD